jgi:hypothetical protein
MAYHASDYQCGCGIPNRANYYVGLVVGRDIDGGTETSHVDWYSCNGHVDTEFPATMLNPEIAAQGWYVIEAEVKWLR